MQVSLNKRRVINTGVYKESTDAAEIRDIVSVLVKFTQQRYWYSQNRFLLTFIHE